ncbi:MAG: hypothetical protein ACR2P1_10400 [Pseudomonadales bacterium]
MKLMERIADRASELMRPFCNPSVPRNTATMCLMGLLLPTAMVLSTAMSAVTVHAADDLKHRITNASFLQPYKPRLVLPSGDPALPQFCSKLGDDRRCPEIASNYGAFPSPGIDDITTGYKNVRVSMYISSISNTAVEGGGVDPGDDGFVWWDTSSVEADEENGGPYAWTLPGPGETYDNFGPHEGFFGARIYDALVFGACGSLTSFDIGHNAELKDGGSQIGLFQAADHSTIDSTGYYNVDYTVTAEDGTGGVSNFRFKGKLNVLCSGLVGLP